jgi:DNA invertase Pin-like site-specific DNA recombinase
VDDETIRGRYAWWRGQGAAAADGAPPPPDVYDVYARLSYNAQGQKESTDRQVGDCKAMAGRMGLDIGEVHLDDDVSAWQEGVVRPGWERLLGRVGDRLIRGVVIWHVDRLMRRPDDLLRLIRAADAGLTIHSYGGGRRDLNDPNDRRALWYEIIHADSSSQDTSRRVRAALRDAAEKGRPAVGRRGYGYGVPTGVLDAAGREIVDKRRVVEGEAQIVREAARRVLAGEALNAVAEDLAARGVPTVRGGRWEATTLRDILRSPRIAGLRAHRGQIVGKADWDPILDEETWRQLQAAMTARGGRRPRHPERVYLCSGLAVCGREGCGARLAVHSPWEGERARDGGRRVRVSYPAAYYCRRGRPYGGCGGTWVRVADLDAHLSARLRALAADPAALAGAGGAAGAGRDAEAAELARIEADLTVLAQRWRATEGPRRMSMDEYAELRSGLAERRDVLEARLTGRDRPSPAAVADGRLWDEMDHLRRRMFARAVVDAVVVGPQSRRGAPFDPSRAEIRWR